MQAKTLPRRYTVIAIDDTRSHCECCGKTGLKQVVWVLDQETNEQRHYGTTCALQPAKGFGIDGEVRHMVGARKGVTNARIAQAHMAYRAGGGTYTSVAPGRWKPADLQLWTECVERVRSGAQ